MGNPIFKGECDSVFIGLRNLAWDKTYYPVACYPWWVGAIREIEKVVWLGERGEEKQGGSHIKVWNEPGCTTVTVMYVLVFVDLALMRIHLRTTMKFVSLWEASCWAVFHHLNPRLLLKTTPLLTKSTNLKSLHNTLWNRSWKKWQKCNLAYLTVTPQSSEVEWL